MAQDMTYVNGTTNPDISRQEQKITDSLNKVRFTANQYYGVGLESAKNLKERLQQYGQIIFDHSQVYARKYPLLTAFLGAWALLSVVPIAVFVVFAVVSTLITLGGCLVTLVVIQTIILSVAGAILLGIIGSLFLFTCFLSFWAVVLWMGYNGVNKAWDWYDRRTKLTPSDKKAIVKQEKDIKEIK